MSKKYKKKSVEPTLSKKEAKKLKKREAEIAAELARRAEKRTKKAKKKAKAAGISTAEQAALDMAPPSPTEAEMIAAARAKRKAARKAEKLGESSDPKSKKRGTTEYGSEIPEGLKDLVSESKKRDEIIDPETGKTRPEVTAARKAKKEQTAAEIDAEIAARLAVKKAARKEGKAAVVADAANVDRADHNAVMAYNLRAVAVGATLLTSDQEREEIASRGENPDSTISKAVQSHAVQQAAEAVETEHGREFQVGESVNADPADEFAKPSDAEPFLESGRNGYKIIQLDKDGNPDPKVIRQYTRVTTYVGNIDDETALREWKERLLAEGIASDAENFLPRIADLVHRRNVMVAKAEKQDAKGKLGLGELAVLVNAANKAYKTAMNELVQEALTAAGAGEKADAGTHLHTLAELVDARGIDAVREIFEGVVDSDTEIAVTGNDLASMEAYADAMQRMSVEHIISEAVIVNDALRYAGRLDAIKFARLPALVDPKTGEIVRPADGRRKRYVFDVKSGSIEYAAGKISRQLAAYAHGDLYDIPTGDRSPSGVARDVALVVHLPLGTGECHVYAVDLKEGYKLLQLSGSVRAGRTSGRKTINTAIDLATPAVPDESEED